ncbi:hypothetical protein CGCF415_v002089 [Colletotrichum fructicola]|uniref:Uncharacterized protein n=1 Tax=Colletotrichum chrysophilum TaxID=1836956 RepID=A0AAD9EER6_9PEZI|nr:hypothetical protein CGCF415_v002089 [Colletotrichum fructicola]KAI8286917.1 hypothetical protein K4K60_013076 [Colletotrichum sp. SAR11_57]KAJ0348332.1 hypothetical protein KNSL1_005596 [Colletotrichum chrysophilum]KAF4941141.1 hypothetical protein CGCF245_v001872 [Colletotrichum fructicola]KAF5509370.1 hypothetical protein CGCF413_v003882 [Colletotrichum fructicola]
MRSAVIIAAVASMATANPVVVREATFQDGIDLSVFDAAPAVTKTGPAVGAVSETPSYNKAAASAAAVADAIENPISSSANNSTLKARSAAGDAAIGDPSGCSTLEPAGSGGVQTTDSYNAFMVNQTLKDIGNNAPVPQGYQLSFSGKQGSTSQNGYLGLYTLKSFDTILCQQKCDAATACTAFNLYIERDPKYTPTSACQNPPSTINYKCTLWGLAVTSDTATNNGQWRQQFHVGITASNGYVKNVKPDAAPGFDGPTAFGGAINAPDKSFIGSKYFPGPYDASQCTAACQGTTQYDRDHPNADGTYDACNFVNSYVLSENNAPQGTYCGLYTKSWDKKYSTNYGQYRGNDYYSVSSSYGWTLNPQDPGHI